MEGRNSKPFFGWSAESIRAPHHLVSGAVMFDGVVYATHFKEAVVVLVAPAEQMAAGSNLFDAYFHMGTAPFMGMAFLVALCCYHTIVFRDSFAFALRVRRHQLSVRVHPNEQPPGSAGPAAAQSPPTPPVGPGSGSDGETDKAGPADDRGPRSLAMSGQPFISSISSHRLSSLLSSGDTGLGHTTIKVRARAADTEADWRLH